MSLKWFVSCCHPFVILFKSIWLSLSVNVYICQSVLIAYLLVCPIENFLCSSHVIQ